MISRNHTSSRRDASSRKPVDEEPPGDSRSKFDNTGESVTDVWLCWQIRYLGVLAVMWEEILMVCWVNTSFGWQKRKCNSVNAKSWMPFLCPCVVWSNLIWISVCAMSMRRFCMKDSSRPSHFSHIPTTHILHFQVRPALQPLWAITTQYYISFILQEHLISH